MVQAAIGHWPPSRMADSSRSSSLPDIVNPQAAVGKLVENDIEKPLLLCRTEQLLFLNYMIDDFLLEFRLGLQNLLSD